jgi:WD40 repeat protein
VAPRHTFGIKADTKDNLCYLDEQTVIYPSGHNLVIFNTEQKTQKFIPGTENTEGITAMAVSPNHKYVAVAERAKEGEKAQVTIFDLHTLKRRKVLQAVSADVTSREFVSLAFSPDSKNLLTHGGAPDWSLIYWLWEKAKVGAVAKTSNPQNAAIYQCTFNPIDNTVICVTGDGICRFLRITDQTLKPLPGAMGKREPQAYLCHAWMSEDRVVVVSSAAAARARLLLPRSRRHCRRRRRRHCRRRRRRRCFLRPFVYCRAPRVSGSGRANVRSPPFHGLVRRRRTRASCCCSRRGS